MSSLLFPLVAPLIAAAPLPPIVDDAKALQGTWMVVSLQAKGKTYPAAEAQAISLEVKDNVLTFKEGTNPDEKGTIKLDQTKKPRALDLTLLRGGGPRDSLVFIYELKGDSLKLCWRMAGGERPTEFKAEGNDGYMVLKRKK